MSPTVFGNDVYLSEDATREIDAPVSSRAP